MINVPSAGPDCGLYTHAHTHHALPTCDPSASLEKDLVLCRCLNEGLRARFRVGTFIIEQVFSNAIDLLLRENRKYTQHFSGNSVTSGQLEVVGKRKLEEFARLESGVWPQSLHR